MREITRRQFDAFCYARQPLARLYSQEVSWFEALDKTLLATIVRDITDGDYGYVILARDPRRMFRCIDLSNEFCETPEIAKENLTKHISKYENNELEISFEELETETPNEILIPVFSEDKLHPYFKVLLQEPRFEAARNLIKEVVYSYVDVDGHYIEDFQTGGFDARLWELYLYIYLYNAGFDISRETKTPDYHVSFFGNECFIEAVTVNPSRNTKHAQPDLPDTPEEVALLINDYLPIKFGSSLYSKLKKEYWNQEHVTGKPLILAIHDYHMLDSMTWSRSGLYQYLYGVRAFLEEQEGKNVPRLEQIESHTWGEKVIPSNFFAQEGSENISAVLFSNAATITKFNRMGKLAGLGSQQVKLIRVGQRYNPDPEAYEPIPFPIDVDSPEYEESWSESIVMFHNPRAKYPVSPDWFWDISHIWYDGEGGFTELIQPYDILTSKTIAITPEVAKPSGEETS